MLHVVCAITGDLDEEKYKRQQLEEEMQTTFQELETMS